MAISDNKNKNTRTCDSTSLSALSPRLYAAASLVRKGSPCVDVGTDHGYLAAYIYKSGISDCVIAADVNKKPLEAAKRTFEEQGIIGKLSLCLSDGLREISPKLANDIIICGMGGELILRILLDAPYTREGDRRFILQPMTNIPILRKGLYLNGFSIEKEVPVLEGRRGYTVIQASYTGEATEIDEFFGLTGKLIESDSPDKEGVLKLLALKEEKILSGLCNAAVHNEAEINLHRNMLEKLREVISIA